MTHRNDQLGSNVVEITPSDTVNGAYIALYIGVGGDVAVQYVLGATVVHKNAASGSTLCLAPIQRVMATSTTATNILGVIA